MINMPNCRVQNTVSVLRECCEMLEYEEVGDLSESEQKAFTQLLRLCGKIVRFYEPTPAPASESDPVPTKLCTNCGVEKPLTDFNLKPSGGPLSSCKCCRNATRRAQRLQKSEALTEKAVALLQKHGPMPAADLAVRCGTSKQVIGRAVAAHAGLRGVRQGNAVIYSLLSDATQAPKPAPKPQKTKKCTKCKKTLPETAFHFRLTDAHIRHTVCRHCMSDQDAVRRNKRANLIDKVIPLISELLTQHGPMQSDSIIELAHKKWPELQLSYQRLGAVTRNADCIERHRDRRGMGYVYRVVGDTRPVFFEKSALEKEHPPGVERVVDDPEGDAWFANLKAEVAERKAQRARMQW